MKKIVILGTLSFVFITSCYTTETITEITKGKKDISVNREKILELVNQARREGRYCGKEYFEPAEEVVWNEKLELAAQIHSNDMYDNDFFSHTGSDGSDAGERLEAVGYKWITYGENIAKGYENEEQVIKAWLKSEGHCKNIMNPAFKEMGVARAGYYWTQVLATGITE